MKVQYVQLMNPCPPALQAGVGAGDVDRSKREEVLITLAQVPVLQSSS